MPAIITTNSKKFSEIKDVEDGTKPPPVTALNIREILEMISWFPEIYNKIDKDTVYILKITPIVSTNCFNLKLPPPNIPFI